MGSDKRLIGLDSIAFGPAQTATAGMPTAGQLTSITSIVPDSAVLAIDVPAKTEFKVEDSEFADIVINEPGGAMIEFATYDMNPQHFYLGMGGSTTATQWKASNDPVVVTEKSIKAISKTYGGAKVRLDIVRASLRAGGQLRFSRSGPGMITYQADVLRPIMANTDVPITVAFE